MQDGPTVTDRHLPAISRYTTFPSLPERLDGLCLFLDLDGTLLDLAEAPDAVIVPEELQAGLTGLAKRLDGALALVTGRPLAFVDRLFPGNRFFLAGLHGAEIRAADSAPVSSEVVDFRLEAAKKRLRQVTAKWPGVLVEDKGRAVAVHYRQAPAMELPMRALMEEIAPTVPGWVLQPGKFVVELRPRGHDKGDALRVFMERNPFAGRLPLAIGDDVTDEAMFAVANAMGGTSMRVGRASTPTMACGRIETPDELRRWIASQVG